MYINDTFVGVERKSTMKKFAGLDEKENRTIGFSVNRNDNLILINRT